MYNNLHNIWNWNKMHDVDVVEGTSNLKLCCKEIRIFSWFISSNVLWMFGSKEYVKFNMFLTVIHIETGVLNVLLPWEWHLYTTSGVIVYEIGNFEYNIYGGLVTLL